MKSEKRVILNFSGFNQRAVISFCRIANRYSIPFYIIALSPDDEIYLSQYTDRVVGVRNKRSLDIDDLTEQIMKLKNQYEYDEYVILPSSEALNRFLLENVAFFERIGCVIPLVNKKLYCNISDKHAFGELCAKNSIQVPGEIEYSDVVSFPVVAKPKVYGTFERAFSAPVIINSQAEWVSFCQEHCRDDYYIQEFVGGQSFYLLYFFHKNGDFVSFSQKNLVQQPSGKSIIAAKPAQLHNAPIAADFVRLFRKEGFYGLVMVEIKYYRGCYYMIEANPRLWGPSQLFVDCGVPIFEYFLQDWGFCIPTDIQPKASESEAYFWFGGLIQSLGNNLTVAFHDYSETQMREQFQDLIQHDVYMRPDTIGIFFNELIRRGA